MKLSSNEQCCRNRFLAEISSGDRPVLSVFHEIRCHQTNIGTFIRKDSDHAGTSPNFTIQSLDHIGRRNFSRVQHGECIEGQRIFHPLFKALNRFRKALGVGVDHIICPLSGDICCGRQPDSLEYLSEGFLLFLRHIGQNIPHEMHLTALPRGAGKGLTDCRNQPGVCIGNDKPWAWKGRGLSDSETALHRNSWILDRFSMPRLCASFSIFRVDTPCTKASCTTCTSIASLRLRSVTKNGMQPP